MTMKKLLFFLPVVALLLLGCDKEYELERAIFIDDPDKPGLPAYSEWGYNTFGAYYNRTPFVSDRSFSPSGMFIVNGARASLRLEGVRKSSPAPIRIEFVLFDVSPDTYSDLVQLHQRSYDLKNDEVLVIVKVDNAEYPAEILNGTLEIIRAQHLYVDGVSMQTILSGRFAFQSLVNGDPVSIEHGRFDIGFMDDNFFKY
jgi:hypothetical protein